MNIAIVLVNFNGWEDTRLCLKSLTQLEVPASIILVDNASADNRLPELSAEFPSIHALRNEVNGGWAGGNNTGLRFALDHGADWVLLLNNDTTVAPRLLTSLLAAAQKHPQYGILGPVICYMDEPDNVMTDGCVFNHPDREGFFQREHVPLTANVKEVEIVNGCAMFISARVLRTIGLIDEQFFLIHEETDFCLRARQAGFPCGVVGEPLVWHKGSSSFQRAGKKIQRYYDARNLYLLLNKHVDKHVGGRGRFASLFAYGRYVYHRYCHERDAGNRESADAVVHGLYDALRSHFGPMESRPRWGAPILGGIFERIRIRKLKASQA